MSSNFFRPEEEEEDTPYHEIQGTTSDISSKTSDEGDWKEVSTKKKKGKRNDPLSPNSPTSQTIPTDKKAHSLQYHQSITTTTFEKTTSTSLGSTGNNTGNSNFTKSKQQTFFRNTSGSNHQTVSGRGAPTHSIGVGVGGGGGSTMSTNSSIGSATNTSTSYYKNNTHPLQRTFSFSFLKKEKGSNVSESYEQSVKQIGDFSTVEGFWGFYSHLIRPHKMTGACDYHLFVKGVKPMWEDDANKDGGRWMLRLKKEYSSRLWEDLLLAIIGEQFDIGDELCGAVLSIRDHDIISVWNKTAGNQKVKERIRDVLIRVLRLPPGTLIAYQAFADIVNSSKNTDTFTVPPVSNSPLQQQPAETDASKEQQPSSSSSPPPPSSSSSPLQKQI